MSFYNPDNENKASAYFPPLTLDDLNSSYQPRKQQFNSMESDFDMSQSKLQYLGGDLSSLQIVDQQQTPKTDQVDELKNRFNEFSRSVHTYARKFDSGDSTNQFSKIQDQSDISMRMEHFRKKIQDIQHDLESQHTRSPTSDPYKISLHSLHPTSNKKPYSDNRNKTKTQYQPYSTQGNQFVESQKQPYSSQGNTQKYQHHSDVNQNSQNNYTYKNQASNHNYNYNSSVSSGGLSFNPPNLYSTSNKKQATQLGNHLTELELHRIKYYDSYMPEGFRMMNCPYKLLKHKLQNRNKEALTRCFEDFNLMDLELTSSLR